jgi:hypothetical protein
MLGILDMEEHEEMGVGTKITTRFYYSLADGIDPSTLTSPDLAEGAYSETAKRSHSSCLSSVPSGVTAKSGDDTSFLTTARERDS